MNYEWFFNVDNSLGDDFGDHGIEVFKTSDEGAEKFKKFAREMVQNSIDVKNKNIKDPLVVKFSFFDVDISELPSFDSLKEHIQGTIDYCNKKNKKNNAYHNSKQELEFFKKRKVKILKVSDYNTIGILESNNIKKENSAWVGLIYNDGDSVKMSNDALGSHGLGKNAAFVMSKIKTVFYSTKDILGNQAFEGVTKQYVSYVNGKKKFYKGYYGKKIAENQILPFTNNDINSFSKIFRRDTFGSDVIIIDPDISYLSEEYVKWYLIESIICNFFVALKNGDLEVYVNETEINQSTLTQVLYDLDKFYEKNELEISDILIATKQCLFTIDKGKYISEDVKNYGEIDLWLYKDNNIKGKNIAIIRKNGMLIKNYEVRYANQKFCGVVIVQGEEGVKFLRAIEDPNHTDFDPNRATEELYGSTGEKIKRLNVFYEWLRNHAKAFTKIVSDDVLTLQGMENYIQMPSKIERKYDSTIVEPKVIKIQANKVGKSRVAKKTKVNDIDDGTTQVIPVEASSKGSSVPNPNPKIHKTQTEDENSKHKGFVKTYFASFKLGPVIKHNQDESILVFEITESNKNFKIKFCAVDEDGNENGLLPSLLYAKDLNLDEVLKVNRHLILDVKCNGIMKIKVKFDNKVKTCIKPIIYWEE